MKNQNTLIGSIAILMLIVIGCACPNVDDRSNAVDRASVDPSGNNNLATNSVDDPFKGREITWKDYSRVYSKRSNSTDMQKEAMWWAFEGKTVTWEGKVVDVSDGDFGGLAVNIKMEPDTLTSDIRLQLKEDQKGKAIVLTKDKKIKFSGRMRTYGGAILPLSMDDGELK